MIIVNDRNTNIIFSDSLMSINIHSSGLKIMVNPKQNNGLSMVIAEYDKKEKTKRAFQQLLNALQNNQEWFKLPDNEDEQLNTVFYGNLTTGGEHLRTTGKTK